MSILEDIADFIQEMAKENPKAAAIVCLFGIAVSAIANLNENRNK